MINKHPLLAYTIRHAIKSKIFDRVICVTDSKRYQNIAIKYGAEVPKLRPKKLSGDKSSDIEWVMWIMKQINGIKEYEIFSILRPTNPLRKISTTRNAFKYFKKNFLTLCELLIFVNSILQKCGISIMIDCIQF